MENIREQSGEEAPMSSDSYLWSILEPLNNHGYYPNPFMIIFVEGLIKRATETIEQRSKDALLEDVGKRSYANYALPDLLESLASQMTSEILNGNDRHSITLKLLNHIEYYNWCGKAALILAAFAFTFGDFWFHVRIYADNVVNEPMTTDQRELTATNKEAYRNQIEANNEFIKILVKSLQYLSDIISSHFGYVDMPDDRQAINTYWVVRCVVFAATQIIVLSSRGVDQYLLGIRTPIEVEKLKSLYEDLILTLSKTKERERALETTNSKLSNLTDVVGIMRVLVTDKDMPPIYHGETKRKDHLDVLRGKRVLLLISGIDIPSEDIESLKRVTVDPRKDEIVWIPVINNSVSELDPVKNQLEILQNSMPWYSVQPSMVTDTAIYSFKLKWGFNGTPILVLLSPSGEVLRFDEVIHMVRTWQNLSVDNLTRDVELNLWKKETWNLKLLVNDIIIDPIMQQWIQNERYIILYGGNDIDWIRRFTRRAHSLASDLQGHIEMAYMGSRHTNDRGRGVHNVILIEQLSHCLPESNMAYFWTRFDSMFQSKRANEDYSVPKDILLQKMLRFRSHENWALLAKGSTILVNGSGHITLNALEDMEKWRTKLLQS